MSLDSLGFSPRRISSACAVQARTVSDDYVLIRDVMVPMRDGVRLATDIYLPAKDGSAFPASFR